jgi:peptidoglycan/xylan/chitin deacetylase (PgdA/CDA1 family)
VSGKPPLENFAVASKYVAMMNEFRHRLAGALLSAAMFAAFVAPAVAAESSAVFLMYHRFGEDGRAATNIRIDQFEAQLAELASGGYTVMPVPDIVAALRNGTPLPDRAIGITMDDAYRSVYTEAWPRLRAAGFPFTLFISTGTVDAGGAAMMTWDQVRELVAAGVTIGNHTARHGHLAVADRETMDAEIARAAERITAELGVAPALFAYPFGEYGLELQAAARAAGLVAAFGQHSGVAYSGGDMYGLPRFPLNEQYGDLERFRLVTGALAIPATDVTPRDFVLGPNPPPFGFTLMRDLGGLGGLACYASGQGAASIERLGPWRIEVRTAQPFKPGRARINCTAPGPEGRWRWFGVQFYVR